MEPDVILYEHWTRVGPRACMGDRCALCDRGDEPYLVAFDLLPRDTVRPDGPSFPAGVMSFRSKWSTPMSMMG